MAVPRRKPIVHFLFCSGRNKTSTIQLQNLEETDVFSIISCLMLPQIAVAKGCGQQMWNLAFDSGTFTRMVSIGVADVSFFPDMWFSLGMKLFHVFLPTARTFLARRRTRCSTTLETHVWGHEVQLFTLCCKEQVVERTGWRATIYNSNSLLVCSSQW